MALNFFVSRLNGKNNAFMTNAENAEEAQQELREAGSDEEQVVSFFSVDDEVADAIGSIASVNIGQALEALVTAAFNAGLACKE
jgi:hypothetical protein